MFGFEIEGLTSVSEANIFRKVKITDNEYKICKKNEFFSYLNASKGLLVVTATIKANREYDGSKFEDYVRVFRKSFNIENGITDKQYEELENKCIELNTELKNMHELDDLDILNIEMVFFRNEDNEVGNKNTMKPNKNRFVVEDGDLPFN